MDYRLLDHSSPTTIASHLSIVHIVVTCFLPSSAFFRKYFADCSAENTSQQYVTVTLICCVSEVTFKKSLNVISLSSPYLILQTKEKLPSFSFTSSRITRPSSTVRYSSANMLMIFIASFSIFLPSRKLPSGIV